MSLGSMITKARKDAGFSIDDLKDESHRNIRGVDGRRALEVYDIFLI